MKAPADGICRTCRQPYAAGDEVKILTVSHLDSPLVRMVHKPSCVPVKRRVQNPQVGRRQT